MLGNPAVGTSLTISSDVSNVSFWIIRGNFLVGLLQGSRQSSDGAGSVPNLQEDEEAAGQSGGHLPERERTAEAHSQRSLSGSARMSRSV